MRQHHRKSILIAGGGIGGLTLAICAAQQGHSVTVYEQANNIRALGAGIQLSPNAMKVYRALGLLPELSGAAFSPQALEARMGVSGRNIFNVSLTQDVIKEWGAPYLHIHRAELMKVLKETLEALAPNAIQCGQKVVRYRQDKEGVSVQMYGGEIMKADILIGADGLHSDIRAQMHGPDRPRFTGNVAWRAVVPASLLGDKVAPPTACVWMGAGRHAVTYRLGAGDKVNFVGVVETDEQDAEGWMHGADKAQALADFEGWQPEVTQIFEQCEPSQIYRWGLYDRAPLPHWSEGRVSLLGDAAHPMLPFLAQGAAMAIEDSWSLAKHLSAVDEPAAGLQAYQQERRARATTVQARSRANMKRFHHRSQAAQLLNYGPMWIAGRLAPKIIRSQFDSLYGYNPL